MPVLKKLILKEWFRFFFGSCFVLFLLFTIGDLISGLLRGNVTAGEVLINYFLELPRSLNRILPISCLIASLFSINKLKSRNELTAIFAAGYSRKAFLATIIQASFSIVLLQFVVSSYIHPFSSRYRNVLIENAESKFRNLKGKGLKASTIGSGKLWYKTSNYFFSFQVFDKNKKELKDVSIYYFDKDHKFQKKILTKSIRYTNGKWIAQGATTYDLLNKKNFPNHTKSKEIEVLIDETPKDFNQLESDITTLTFTQLYSYIKKLDESGINTNEYQVMFLDKVSSALICIIFALLSSVAMFNPNRRNSSFGKSVGFVFTFTIVYWLIYSYFLELGMSSKVNPIISTFSVPSFFLLFIIYYFLQNRKIAK